MVINGNNDTGAPTAAGGFRLDSPSEGSLQVRVHSGRVGADGVVHFEGLATWRRESGDALVFPIAGSAAPMASNPDCIIWDILGSDVYDGATFEAEGRFFTPGG